MEDTLFYQELNKLLRSRLTEIKEEIEPLLQQYLTQKNFETPLPIYCRFEYAVWHGNKQWRLELDFDDYEWSQQTVKPHFLNALVYLSVTSDSVRYKYQLCSSFNETLLPMEEEVLPIEHLNSPQFVESKLDEVNIFLASLLERFMLEVKRINLAELEYVQED